MRYYPVGLKLIGKRALVVGGGAVAERKIVSLLRFGARIRVMAPSVTPRISKLFLDGKISLVKRKYRTLDTGKTNLVIAATSDDAVNKKIYNDARTNGIWVNVVDDTAKCDFISTAIIRKGNIVISISTDGKDARVSKKFREFLERKLDEFNSGRDKS